MKTNVRHQQETIFFIKKYLLIQSMISSSSETLNTHGGVILRLSFPNNIIFLKKLLFNCTPFLCPLSKKWFILNETYSLFKITEYLSISWVTQRRLFFVPLAWCCFWHALAFSSLLWLVTGCSTFYKLRSQRNQLLQRSSSVIISGTAILNYKEEQVVFQSRAGNTK